jgi:hypothetical protein
MVVFMRSKATRNCFWFDKGRACAEVIGVLLGRTLSVTPILARARFFRPFLLLQINSYGVYERVRR